MWENIVVILLIILFSYLFRQTGSSMSANNKSINTFDTQMLFILLSLGSLIFYKLTFVKNMEKDQNKQNKSKLTDVNTNSTENFENISNIIRNFSESNSPQTEDIVNQDQSVNLDLIKDELASLRGMVNNMKVENSKNLTPQDSETDPQTLIGYQNLQLNNLENVVNEIKKNRLDAEDKNINKTFKKIPVYNSCYVINADNSVSGGSTSQTTSSVSETSTSDQTSNETSDNDNNNQQGNIINQSTGSGNVNNMSLKEANIKNMADRLDKLEGFFDTLMNKFTNIKLLV